MVTTGGHVYAIINQGKRSPFRNTDDKIDFHYIVTILRNMYIFDNTSVLELGEIVSLSHYRGTIRYLYQTFKVSIDDWMVHFISHSVANSSIEFSIQQR